MSNQSNTPPYQDGFLITLIILAIVGLIWLFLPFLAALFFSLIVATATYQLFLKLQHRWKLSDTVASTVMSILIFFTVIAPITYLLVEISLRTGELYGSVQGWVDAQDSESLKKIYTETAKKLPFDLGDQSALIAQLDANLTKLITVAKNTVVFLLRSIFSNTAGFLTFVFLSVFALFFFYRDGDDIARQIKVLSPLPNRYDELLMVRFSSLATVLTISVVIVALLQGVSFGILMSFLGLPALFLGIGIAVTSFIPVVGSALIWIPVAVYLYLQGEVWQAILVVVWGMVIMGFVIDNVLRPVMIQKISKGLPDGGNLGALDHTLLTVLSTLAGLIQFGIIGMLFGPVIAAMAIAIFDVYEQIHGDTLDRENC
ncbi:MAG: AI-2E family transporter [Candidatus Thiodiazotropha endolucinida]|uniref:AI-2E family transporter n=2 Tax=Candidatus Thiodiazotropha TaxID=1913444 RepID=A0A9E4JT93_9GAMM|nr:AI-2E family transporter [Candidatus Thiodiazotropha endolucinida]MBT3010533.1 AI-2E family transporter [Candidatus Thiodiazotropha sp. (ex Lucina pensylvanica)]MBT3016195.1 AI-2E family transporter [Candidatus Thiodiazotropha taylori]MBT3040217.1 AI-2E family transporter [Candidatus Thiodiazotropha sp. (ex Codakia orbicularis)]MBT3030829.1 AI-2E family transporter [Candidatus Thiodiazotropha sp. (ex Lucina pensylvanica)]MBT3042775.1 AI-2E family transporter [Candidatus Thiodiazotropha sp. 